jgi:hypothetical protein
MSPRCRFCLSSNGATTLPLNSFARLLNISSASVYAQYRRSCNVCCIFSKAVIHQSGEGVFLAAFFRYCPDLVRQSFDKRVEPGPEFLFDIRHDAPLSSLSVYRAYCIKQDALCLASLYVAPFFGDFEGDTAEDQRQPKSQKTISKGCGQGIRSTNAIENQATR